MENHGVSHDCRIIVGSERQIPRYEKSQQKKQKYRAGVMSVYGRVAAHGVAATGSADAADDDWDTDPDYVVSLLLLVFAMLHHTVFAETQQNIIISNLMPILKYAE